MQKFTILLVSLFVLICPAFATKSDFNNFNSSDYGLDTTDAVELISNEQKNSDINFDNDISSATTEKPDEKTLKEKFQDIYHLEVTRIDKPTFLMQDILTKRFGKDSALESIQVGGGYVADWSMLFSENGSITNDYEYNAISPFVEGIFKDNNADFKLMIRFSPKSSMNWMQYLVSDAYIATNKIPHHRVQVGNFRPPVGYEGERSPYLLDFISRSQLASTLGTTRKFGARVKGNFSLVDYDLGGYSSDTFWQEFFPGTEFIGWMNIKPLGLTNGKYGNLVLGGGVQTGHRNNDYTVASTHVGYEYKKFNFDFEYANANGYNGFQMRSTDKHAGGYYISLGYRITPKIQCLVCYDEFDYDKSTPGNKQKECTVGLNYFIKGQGLRLMLNYAFCKGNASVRNSHRIMLGTQILI